MENTAKIKIPWTNNDYKYLKQELLNGESVEDISANLGRSVKFIKNKINTYCCKLHALGFAIDKIMEKTQLTKEQIEELIKINDESKNDDSNDNHVRENMTDTNIIATTNSMTIRKIIRTDETDSVNTNTNLERKGAKYLNEECDNLLAELCDNKSMTEIAIMHKRTEGGVYCKIIQILQDLIKNGKQINSILPQSLERMCEEWTYDEYKNLIMEIKQNKPIGEIAIIHQRHKHCIDKELNIIYNGLGGVDLFATATDEEIENYLQDRINKANERKKNTIDEPIPTNQGNPWNYAEDMQLMENLKLNKTVKEL